MKFTWIKTLVYFGCVILKTRNNRHSASHVPVFICHRGTRSHKTTHKKTNLIWFDLFIFFGSFSPVRPKLSMKQWDHKKSGCGPYGVTHCAFLREWANRREQTKLRSDNRRATLIPQCGMTVSCPQVARGLPNPWTFLLYQLFIASPCPHFCFS